MIELGYESISGTPGTSASLTVTAITTPLAYPRLSDVATLGFPIHYVIEDSTGLVLESGVGLSTAAGSFTRTQALTQWGGSGYTTAPSALYSLPSGCTIYCALSAFAAPTPLAPTCNVDANRWFEPTGLVVGSTAVTLSGTGRDNFWRFENRHPFKVDRISLSAAGSVTADVCIYAVDWSTGKPGKLLLGWKSASLVSGWNDLTLATRTDGAMAAAAGPLPQGPLYGMINVATGVNIARSVQGGIASFGGAGDQDGQKVMLYHDRTQGTSLVDNPTITGRLSTAFAYVPALVFRGA